MGESVQRILAGQVWTPQRCLTHQFIDITAGKIEGLAPTSAPPTFTGPSLLDASDGIVIPGLIDLQVNGALGWSFQAADRDHWREIVDFYVAAGTTTLLPTLVTAHEETLCASLRGLSGFLERSGPVTLPGIHLEGPFLAPAKRGAHAAGALQEPDLHKMQQFDRAARDNIRMVTLAPELPGALLLIAYLARRGVVVAAGHSVAKLQEMRRAMAAGLAFVTHAGNATDWPHRVVGERGFRVSEPGVVGALLAKPKLGGSVIMDGYHFPPALLAPLLRLKGPQRLLLVSDASTVVGCPPGDYDSGGLAVTVHPEGFATDRREGSGLAGSTITLLQAVRRAIDLAGIAPLEAVTMASLGPARWLGLEERKGQIKVGADADLVVLNADLSLRHVIVGGHLVPSGDGPVSRATVEPDPAPG